MTININDLEGGKKEVVVKISNQAKALLSQFKSFDEKGFCKWFYGEDSPYMMIGSTHIIDYLTLTKNNGNTMD